MTMSLVNVVTTPCASWAPDRCRFQDALSKTARWRIDRERLELFDDADIALAQFESRYLR